VIAEYGYDGASQLTNITYQRAGTVLGDLIYEYGAVGNRVRVDGSFARTTIPEAVSALTYDAANQLTQQDTTSLSYDANGNLTSDGVLSYVWDTRGQLASFSGSGIAASFQYDAFGRRINKSVNGTTTEFLYDGLNVVQELSGGTPTANLLSGLGIDDYFLRTDAHGAQILLFDALGSTLGLLDTNGVLQTEYTYGPFGETTATGAASPNPFQYTGRENDATGLYYYRARYYSPTLRRFISEDPLGLDYDSFGNLASDSSPALDLRNGFAGGLTDLSTGLVRFGFRDYEPAARRSTARDRILFAGNQANSYMYVGNNPINFRDPSGLKPDDNPFQRASHVVDPNVKGLPLRPYIEAVYVSVRDAPLPEAYSQIVGPLSFGLQVGAVQDDLFRRLGKCLP
jgi:RHS repeat-associated protein